MAGREDWNGDFRAEQRGKGTGKSDRKGSGKSDGKGSGKSGGKGSKGRRRDRSDEESHPAAVSLMEDLLALPEEVRSSLGAVHSYAHSRRIPAPVTPPGTSKTFFGTVELDSFATARLLVERGWNPAVLNLANEYNCGGGWCGWRGSQEEDLFLNSSLPLSLWPTRRPDDNRLPEFNDLLPRSTCLYPWSEAQALFSPNVLVCRANQRPLPHKEQVLVAVVSSAAQDLRTDRRHYAGPFDEELTRQKLRTLLWACSHHGHKAVVLGAYGCGAFQNDPFQIAEAMRKVIDAEFSGVFDVVLQGVIKSRENFRAFKRWFPDSMDDLPQGADAPRACHAISSSSGPAVPAGAALDFGNTNASELVRLAGKLRWVLELQSKQQAGRELGRRDQQTLQRSTEWLEKFESLLAQLPAEEVPEEVADVLTAFSLRPRSS